MVVSGNLNEFLETLHLAPIQFGDLPGFYRKTGFLRFSLFNGKKYLMKKIY